MIPTHKMIEFLARQRQEQLMKEAKVAGLLHELRRLTPAAENRPLIRFLPAQVQSGRHGV